MTDSIQHTNAQLGHWYSVDTSHLPGYADADLLATLKRLSNDWRIRFKIVAGMEFPQAALLVCYEEPIRKWLNDDTAVLQYFQEKLT